MVSDNSATDPAQTHANAPAAGLFKKTVDNLSRVCGVLAASMIVVAVLITF